MPARIELWQDKFILITDKKYEEVIVRYGNYTLALKETVNLAYFHGQMNFVIEDNRDIDNPQEYDDES